MSKGVKLFRLKTVIPASGNFGKRLFHHNRRVQKSQIQLECWSRAVLTSSGWEAKTFKNLPSAHNNSGNVVPKIGEIAETCACNEALKFGTWREVESGSERPPHHPTPSCPNMARAEFLQHWTGNHRSGQSCMLQEWVGQCIDSKVEIELNFL